MEARNQFTFYKSFLDSVRDMTCQKEQVQVLFAICDYALYGMEPELTGNASAVFRCIRPNLDAARRKAENGKRGGQSSRSEAKPKQREREKELEKENEIEIENENEIESETEYECKAAGAEENHHFVFDAYQTYCGKNLMPWEIMTEQRKEAINAFFRKGYTQREFERVFQKAGASFFLSKKNAKGWKAGIDWLLEERNFARVLEGAFDDNAIPKGASGTLGQAELEAIQQVLREVV